MGHHKGAKLHSEALGYGTMSGLLRKIANKVPPEPRKVKPEPGHKGKVTISDETVVEIRRRYESGGISILQLCSEYPEISESYIRRLLTYEVRLNAGMKKGK